ncbi:hypothetical protein Pfo_023193, partial [Paulownia fortunei]
MIGWSCLWLVVVVIPALIVGRATAMGEVLCNDAVSQLLPCGDFLENKAAAPSADCCGAVQSLDKIAKASPEYRKILCACFRDAADSSPINVAKAQQLPKLCNVTDSVKIGPNVNFDKSFQAEYKMVS